ncbi:MAG: UMP kinase [Patescibacteria group bacterium]
MLIFSLGGSIINPGKIDIKFLREFKDFCVELVNSKEKIAIITGGGFVAREYQEAARKFNLNNKDILDKLGIRATKINAELLISILGDLAYDTVLETPNDVIDERKEILVFSGWKHGWSTDYVTTCVSERFNVKRIFNLTNIPKVYNKEKQDIDKLNWNEYLELIGNDWEPGMNTPFDPIASKKARDLGITVFVLKGTDLDNLKKAIKGKKFNGTIIS